MNWVTLIRRTIGVALVVPILIVVFKPMQEILNRATTNNLLVMSIIVVYAALCLWGLLAWSKGLKK